MIDYSNGKIYKICDVNEIMVYIGSTTQDLCERMAQHRRDYKRYKNGKINCITVFQIFEKFGIENCKIYLVENICCENKEQLLQMEAKYIRELQCVNKCIPDRTAKEYYLDNKNKILEYKKQHYLNNKEKKKEYYLNNKEKISEYKKSHRDRYNELARIRRAIKKQQPTDNI